MARGRILTAMAVLAAAMIAGSHAAAFGLDRPGAAAESQDISAQRSWRRARPAIRVYPRPLTRECRVRYVREWRVSGPVIVPAMRCWWAPG